MHQNFISLLMNDVELQILHNLCCNALYSSYSTMHKFLQALRDEKSNEIAALIKKIEELNAKPR